MKKLILAVLPFLIMAFAFTSHSKFKVTGWVVDQQGSAIPFASIVEKGGGGVQSDQHGFFTIEVSHAKATLQFSAVGYQTKEIAVNGKQIMRIVMKPAATTLQEVVITQGYNTKRMHGGAPAMTAQGYYSDEAMNTEDYDYIKENGFKTALDNPLSTFSIDVDGASYSNVRRFLTNGQLPPAGAVRVEEMINYFPYQYKEPVNGLPFAFHTETGKAPWNNQHQLVMIGMQGKKIPTNKLPASNLVFLIDVSGSMMSPNKLDLVKSSMKLLVDQLREKDKVSIVVYAGAAGLVLSPTDGGNKTAIKDALDRLEAGGSTAGGAGIELAYKTARENFKRDGNNRVILCTDGDFNVGMSSDDEMERLIEKERKSGVYLTVLGYGMGNYKDDKMQKLANKGNGNHAYIDGLQEAKKVLVNEFGGTLFTIAKDVKLQVEFNPKFVQAYRLVGYENRLLNKEDFNDDKKDAGELGSGHTVTAIYEIIPVGVQSAFVKTVDPLKYSSAPASVAASTDELMTIKFRYKEPEENVSKLIVHAVKQSPSLNASLNSDNFRFATAVAQFGMLLRDSEFKGSSNYTAVMALAQAALGSDPNGYRQQFVNLVKTTMAISKNEMNKTGAEIADRD